MLLSGDGGPAGGSLAGVAALVRGGITLSGLFDLRPLRLSWLQPTLQLTERACEDQSPLLRIPRQAAPLLVSVGSEESDAFIGQSQRYHAAWQAAGLASRYSLQPGANHYTAIYGLGDRASPLAQMIAEFLR
jgi:arylformamidase